MVDRDDARRMTNDIACRFRVTAGAEVAFLRSN